MECLRKETGGGWERREEGETEREKEQERGERACKTTLIKGHRLKDRNGK